MKKLILILIAACAIVLLTFTLLQTNDDLTITDVEQKVAAAYHGNITHSEQQDDTYAITFTNDTGEYIVHTKRDGTFIALTQTKTLQRSSSPAEQPTQQEQAPAIQLTLDEVLAIAQKRFNGTLEDYELFDSSTGGYYMLELENDEQEVHLQIHAMTGDILSVVYDD